MNEKYLEGTPYSAGTESETPAAGGKYIDWTEMQESGNFFSPNRAVKNRNKKVERSAFFLQRHLPY